MKTFTQLKDKTILVTGGTGTFGRAFVRRILQEKVKKVIVFSRDELKQSEMQQEFKDHAKRLRFFLGDIRDLARLERAFEGVDIVVHAAALKQVPATEYNPMEAVKTNIIGSQNVVDAAINKKVKKAILISSDKAVWPVNLYGATKLAAEKLFVAANAYVGDNPTKFSVMRYGNVVGSRGSFIELIQRQKQTGIITVTHELMTRFWIRIDQVVDVILECTDMMQGGEIFVPKMKNMLVADVVKVLAPDCEIKITGIRPGEKMHETLVTDHEAPRTKDVGPAYAIRPEFGSTNLSYLDKKPDMPKDFVFISNNPKFTLSAKEAKQMFNA